VGFRTARDPGDRAGVALAFICAGNDASRDKSTFTSSVAAPRCTSSAMNEPSGPRSCHMTCCGARQVLEVASVKRPSGDAEIHAIHHVKLHKTKTKNRKASCYAVQ
jgi:hypothetical protein